MVIFDDRTTIGMVRLYAKEIGEELGLVLSGSKSRKPQPARALSSEYTESAESKLDDLLHE